MSGHWRPRLLFGGHVGGVGSVPGLSLASLAGRPAQRLAGAVQIGDIGGRRWKNEARSWDEAKTAAGKGG